MTSEGDNPAGTVTEGNLNWELQYTLLGLRTAAKVFAELDLENPRSIQIEVLAQVDKDLRAGLLFFDHLFTSRGEATPGSPSMVSFASYSRLLMKRYPRSVAQRIEEELEAVGSISEARHLDSFHALGLYFKSIDALRFLTWLERKLGRVTPPATPAPAPTPGSPAGPPPATMPSGSVPAVSPAAVLAAPPHGAPAAAEVAAPPPLPTPLPQLDLTPFNVRPDEAGAHVRSGAFRLWHASCRGPDHAEKVENESATAAEALPDGLAFALAEGVHHSLGARLSAVVSSRSFCELAVSSRAGGLDALRSLQRAMMGTQYRLGSLARALIGSGHDSPALRQVRGELPAANALKLLQNTVAPDPRLKHVRPALATLLVGGIVVKGASGIPEVFLVRLGAAYAERKSLGEVSTLFPAVPDGAVPPEVVLAPGPAGDGGLKRLEYVGPMPFTPGEHILLASVGFGRGHKQTVWGKLQEVEPAFDRVRSSDDKAIRLLRNVSRKADVAFARGSRIFGDNLALVLLSFESAY